MRVQRGRVIWILPLILIAAHACTRDVDRSAQLTSTLREIVAGPAIPPASTAVWKDVRAFYEQREGAPAWVSDAGVSRATDVLQVLRTAPSHGFAPSDYGEQQLTDRLAMLQQSQPQRQQEQPDQSDRIQQLAEFDARLTVALLAFGHDVAVGRTTPAVLDRRWKDRREAPDVVGTLKSAVRGDLKAWVDGIRPQHPEYAALQQALVNLQAQRAKGGWPTVPVGTFASGKSNPAMVTLRQRLASSGHLEGPGASNTSPSFTEKDEAGVRAFQELHGLKGTGVADAATLSAMNVPLDDRIQQVALNLERWRWMPDDFGARHLLVNIPSFHLIAREHGKTVMDMRVVVGKPDEHKTPVFSSEMATVVFSPYWNIPESIVEGETAPAIARDPGYLAKNNIEILNLAAPGAPPVDYSAVDWDDARQLKRFAFRQRPGAGNALGHVKFLFPNDFDVYLHDTPADALFARTSRALSHGCVRVEQPEALAKYVLRGDGAWDDPKILEAMHSGVEKHVRLKEKIPVHIVYFTTWVDEHGGLHFQPDVYKYDAVQASRVRS